MRPPAPVVSVVMPIGDRRYIADAMQSVLSQSFGSLELICVGDANHGQSYAMCQALADHRTHILHQPVPGLARARNIGIAAARGDFVALIDSTDIWEPDKLMAHVMHLRSRMPVGISYAGATLIDEDGIATGRRQRLKVGPARPHEVFCGKAMGSCSTAFFRRKVFEAIAYCPQDADHVCYFDETLTGLMEIECWTRISLTTDWGCEGIPGLLTRCRTLGYRVVGDIAREQQAWGAVIDKLAALQPDLVARYGDEAHARLLRALARRCIPACEGRLGLALLRAALTRFPGLLLSEIEETVATTSACLALTALPRALSDLLFPSFSSARQARS